MKKRVLPLVILFLVTVSLCIGIEHRMQQQKDIDLTYGHARSLYSTALIHCAYAIDYLEKQDQDGFEYLFEDLSTSCAEFSKHMRTLTEKTDLEATYPLAVGYLFDFCEQVTEVKNTYTSVDISALKAHYALLTEGKGLLEQHIPLHLILHRLEAQLEENDPPPRILSSAAL